MSSVLFDEPGPKARARHRAYAIGFVALSLVVLAVLIQRFRSQGVVTSDVFNEAFQNSNVRFLYEGLIATLEVAAVSIVTSILLGALLAVGRLSDHRPIRWPCVAVIEFFRAVPLVLLIVFAVFLYSLPRDIDPLVALITGLTLYNGSVLAEVFRAGVNAVPKGQSEAAYALGMRKTQVMSVILMPQAVKFMLPAIISQCVIILKDSSLGALIGYEELVRNTRQVTLFVDNGTIVLYSTTALVFIAINYSLSKFAEYLERRLARRGARPLDAEALESGVGTTTV